MAVETVESRFAKWLTKNPGGSMDQFNEASERARAKFRATPPNVGYLPNGIALPLDSVDKGEFAEISREIVNSSYETK